VRLEYSMAGSADVPSMIRKGELNGGMVAPKNCVRFQTSTTTMCQLLSSKWLVNGL
jgi:hypothetical protein